MASPRTVEEMFVALETRDRSKLWVFVSCDRDPDGSLKLVNATGIYGDEWMAALAGENYVRAWEKTMNTDEDPAPEVFAIPLYLEEAPTRPPRDPADS